MLDFEKEEPEESRLVAYQRKIKERKILNTSFNQSNPDVNDDVIYNSSSDSSTSNTELMIKVDEKIEVICTIDKEYQDTVSLIQQAELRAKDAINAANDAAEKSAGFGKKKKAIKALQLAQKEQSCANETNTQALTKMALLQERVIEATKALFALGVSSVAANRSVYRQLELKLKDASEQELSDFARNEVLAVMQQLNDQQDMMAKHKKLSDEVHIQKDQLETQNKIIEELKLQMKQQKEQFEKELNKLKNLIAETEENQDENKVSSSDKASNTTSEDLSKKSETAEKKKWWQRKH